MSTGLTKEELMSKGAQPRGMSFQELQDAGASQVKGRGLLETIVKRPVERLLLEPVRRTTEAAFSMVGSDESKQRALEGSKEDKTINVPLLGKFETKGIKSEGATKQIVGEGLETVSWLIPPAKASAVIKSGFQGLGQAAKQGAIYGATAGSIGGAGVNMQEGESAVEGAVVGGLAGAALGGFLAPLPAAVPALRRARIEKTAKEIDQLSQTITQGKTKDLAVMQRSIREIDAKGINDYSDLIRAFNDKVGVLAQKSDQITGSKPSPIPMRMWATKTRVGDTVIKQNPVTDSLNHLEEVYRKTNMPAEAERIVQLRNTANSIGLNPTQVNQIAREYGLEFGQKAFSKTGEPLTGVNARAFENTRKSLKQAILRQVDDPAFLETDRAMSDFIRLRSLSKNVNEKVNQLRGRTQKRSLGEQAGRALFNLIDALTFRGAGGFIRAVMPRGAGFKVMNAIDLEKNLQKNIKQLQKVLDAKDDRSILQAIKGMPTLTRTPQSQTQVKSQSVSSPKSTTKGIVDKAKDFYKKNLSDEGGYLAIGGRRYPDAKTVANNIDGSDYVILDKYADLLQSGKVVPPEFGMKAEKLLDIMKVDTTDTKGLVDWIRTVLGKKMTNMKKLKVN
jgi:hypothetical protein